MKDWRDPNMTVTVQAKVNCREVSIELPPAEVTAIYAARMAGAIRHGDWRKDPTYNLRRKHEKI